MRECAGKRRLRNAAELSIRNCIPSKSSRNPKEGQRVWADTGPHKKSPSTLCSSYKRENKERQHHLKKAEQL